jgi:hypothetical protein
MMNPVMVLNFSHPLTDGQRQRIAALLNTLEDDLLEHRVQTQIEHAKPLALEATRLVDAVGWTAETWESAAFLVNPPGLSVAALAVIAEIHGRCGHFPTVICVAPVVGSTPLEFVVNEVINLQAVRDQARVKRH